MYAAEEHGAFRAGIERSYILDVSVAEACGDRHYDGSDIVMTAILQKARRSFTLIEVLCVMAIIVILVSLMRPAIGKALRKARGLGNHLGGPGGVEMRIDEVITDYTRYRIAHPKH